MVDQGGSQLKHLLANTNPWAGGMCGRETCPTCYQGGERKQNEDCFRRNVLYGVEYARMRVKWVGRKRESN